MQVHGCKYLQDYRRPFSSCKPNEEWPHVALPCYNESEKELFLYEKFNSGYINKGQVDNFVKCLELVPVYRIIYKNKP